MRIREAIKTSAKILVIVSAVALTLSACRENDIGRLRELELEYLDKYIIKEGITAKPLSSGLYYIELQRGTGDTIKAGDQVDILYRTWVLRDSLILIDQNITPEGIFYEPLRFTVAANDAAAGVVAGLNQGVKLMQDKGKARMIMPSQVAYGQYGSGTVPGFATLVMEVTIYRHTKAQN